jgi:3-keto-5-aminohexanoate cleavage enzyme
MSGEARGLIMLVDRLKAGQTWAVAGVGRYQLPLALQAIAMGGHVRCGIEDNIFYRKGQMAKSNAELIGRIARIAKECDRNPATSDEARTLLGFKIKIDMTRNFQ